LVANAAKLFTAKLQSLYANISVSELLERSELESDILHLTPQPWASAIPAAYLLCLIRASD